MDLPGIATGIAPYAATLTMRADGAETAVPAERLTDLVLIPGDRVRAEVRNPRPPLITGVLGTRPTYADYLMSLEPVGYWKCDDASGNLQDASGNGYHFSAQLNTLYHQGAGWAGNNASLYSVGWSANGYQYRSPKPAAMNPDYDDEFTICFWCRPTASTGADQYIFSSYYSSASYWPYLVAIQNAATKFWLCRKDSGGHQSNIVSASAFSYATWYFVCARRLSGHLNLCVNTAWATPVADASTSTTANGAALFIARYQDAAANYYYGFIDELAYFGRALTDEECGALYCLGKYAAPSGW